MEMTSAHTAGYLIKILKMVDICLDQTGNHHENDHQLTLEWVHDHLTLLIAELEK